MKGLFTGPNKALVNTLLLNLSIYKVYAVDLILWVYVIFFH